MRVSIVTMLFLLPSTMFCAETSGQKPQTREAFAADLDRKIVKLKNLMLDSLTKGIKQKFGSDEEITSSGDGEIESILDDTFQSELSKGTNIIWANIASEGANVIKDEENRVFLAARDWGKLGFQCCENLRKRHLARFEKNLRKKK